MGIDLLRMAAPWLVAALLFSAMARARKRARIEHAAALRLADRRGKAPAVQEAAPTAPA